MVIFTALVFVAVSAFRGGRADNNVHKKTTAGAGKGFALIELFTSEGCSSCPPADDLVARIAKEDKDEPVYVLGYHVDYWDHLGWRDEFSKAEYSARQRKYAGWLHLDQIYTPQIVVNGKTEFVGSNETALRGAISNMLHKQSTAPLTFTDTRLAAGTLTLRYELKGNAGDRALLVAFVQKNAQSHVKSGENGGRTLSHVNIVRDLNTAGLHQAAGVQNLRVPAGFDLQGWEIVAFLQNTATGEVLSAQKITNLGV